MSDLQIVIERAGVWALLVIVMLAFALFFHRDIVAALAE